MLQINYVNPAVELSHTQDQHHTAQTESVFAATLVEQAIKGRGDHVAARSRLGIARNTMGQLLQKEEFWSELVKQELGGYKQAWELIKD